MIGEDDWFEKSGGGLVWFGYIGERRGSYLRAPKSVLPHSDFDGDAYEGEVV